MEFAFKSMITTITFIILIATISLLAISIIFIAYISAPQSPEVIAPVYDNHNYEQTPYAIVTTSPIITPSPTPTPLYYQKLKNPDNPCSEDYTIFYRDCMGAIPKSDEYCAYWNYEYRKNCKFAQW